MKKTIQTAVLILIPIALIVLISINISISKKEQELERQAIEKKVEELCYRNMTLIEGAVEMYNLDAEESSEMSSNYSSYEANKPMTQLDLQKLHESRYLREIPKCPQDGTYSGTDLLGERPTINCSIHGTKTR